MKRYLSLALIVLMLPALLAVPARADEFNTNNWINVLDYGYRVGDTDNRIDLTSELNSSNRVAINYFIPAVSYISDVDIIFRTDSTDFVMTRQSSGAGVLTIIHLNDDLYRAVGTIDRDFSNNLYLYLTANNGTFFEILSYRASLVPFAQYAKTCHGIIYRGGNGLSGQRPIMFPVDSETGIQNLIVIDNEGQAPMYFHAGLEVSQWQGMDYIQLNLSSYCTSIDSINVMVLGDSVPFYVNYVNAERSNRLGLTVMDLLIDVRGLDKNFNQAVHITVSGTLGANLVGNFAIQDCFGLIEIEQPSLWTNWFTQVGNWISNQTSALVSAVSSWGQNVMNSISAWGQNLKDSIDALPDKIAEALQAVFVPSDSAVENMGQQSQELAQDRFGGVYEGALIVDDFASQLKPQQAIEILTVPVVNLDILGTPFPLGGWEVDLVPDGTEIIAETCKIIIDIVATLAFINGLKSRLERTLEQ